MTHISTLSKWLIAAIAVSLAFAGMLGSAPTAKALESLDSIESGDLVRGESFSAVYYVGEDGFRYVFPNDKTYFTWYDDFDDVKFLSDSDLARIQIGGNVTYKPGVRMIKITSDPKTYAVDSNGVLRHIGSEDVAIDLYGSSWNTMIDDMPDGFFTNYSIGDEIVSSSEYDADMAEMEAGSINDDKELMAPEVITITDDGYDPVDVEIVEGQTVKFINDTDDNHSVTGDDLSWGSGTIKPGYSYLERFEDDGTYTFFDGYDSSNTGAVYVD